MDKIANFPTNQYVIIHNDKSNLNVTFLFLYLFYQVDRVSYLLQEIYGIENKNNQETKVPVKI